MTKPTRANSKQTENQPVSAAGLAWRSWRWPALRTALIVVIIGALWVVFSDKAANVLFTDPEEMKIVQRSKGLVFMVLNAFVIYILIALDLKRLRGKETELRESQMQLRRERDFTSSIIQTADTIIIVLNPRGEIIQFNRAAGEFSGLEEKDALGAVFWDNLVPREHRDQVMQALSQIPRDKNHVQFDGPLLNRAGQSRLIAWRGSLFFNPSGNFECVVLTGLDVSDQRLTERELATHRVQLQEIVDTQARQLSRSEQIFRLMFDNVFDGIIMMNGSIGIMDVNQGICRMLDTPREEMIQMRAPDIVAGNSYNKFHEAAAKLKNEKATVFLRLSLKSRSGASIPVEAGGVHITVDGESCMIWSFRDISQRLRAEEEIVKLSSAVQQSPSMILIANTEGGVNYFNPRFEQISGFSLPGHTGAPLRQMFCSEESPTAFDTIWAEVEAGRTWRGEVKSKRLSGEPYWQQASISPIKNDEGEFTHVVLVAEEITEKKTAELALQQFATELADKTEELNAALAQEKQLGDLRSRFIAMVSHEIRTPLTTIQAASDVLKRYSDKLSPAEREERLNKIQTQVQLMTGMLEDALILGEGEATPKPKPRVGSLAKILDDIVGDIMAIKPPNCALKQTIRFDRDNILVDENLFRRIFMNLLTNALKYSPQGGNVYFSVVCVNDVLNIVVQDEGKGIPEDDIPHIYSPFHRGSNVEDIQGTGLGLTIVKQAVDQLDGTIKVRSRPGKGSIFMLTIPLKPEIE